MCMYNIKKPLLEKCIMSYPLCCKLESGWCVESICWYGWTGFVLKELV